MSILVSVIIPCFNVKDYIEECLNSVFFQTYKNVEIIVVDNNCTDDTIQRAVSFSDRNEIKIKIIKETHQGAASARSTGIKISKGTWLQFLDADDLLLPKKLEHQINLIENDTCLIAGATIERGILGKEKLETPNTNIGYGLLKGYRNVGSTCSNLWQKDAVLAVGGFDKTLFSGEEYDLMCKLFTSGKKFILDENPLTIIRARKMGQITQQNTSRLNFYYLKVIERHLQILQYDKMLSADLPLKINLFVSILRRLTIQSIEFPKESARQYHSVFYPTFKNYVSFLPLKERIKLNFYNVFGYENVRKILNKRMQWSQ